MFSSRFHWDLTPNRPSELLQGKRREGIAVLDLTESNPTRAGFSYPVTEILGAISDPCAMVYEPAPAGLWSARQAVSGYYASRGSRVEPERVLLTASTSEAYSFAFKLLTDPGDEILVPRPSYPLFEFLATMESVCIASYPLVYHGEWSLDLEALMRAIGDRTRAIVLVNPNNPTGSFIKSDEMEALVEICRQRNIAIVSDEVFADYAFGPDARRVTTWVDVPDVLTLCLSGLSKVAGLPQMKLGWMVIGGSERMRHDATQKLELIADTYLSVAAPVQHAVPALLEAGRLVREQISARLRMNLTFLQQAVRDTALRVLNVEGGWYAILQVPRTRSEEEWVIELLVCDEVLVQPGFFYDFESEAFLVVSLLTEISIFREGIRRLIKRAK